MADVCPKESKPKISATVITKNEEDNIAECLASLSWADEIVVLDSGSTDRTVQIAKQFTDKVYVEIWRGQGLQKNRAVELAQGPWIFSIDADERTTPELADEIQQAIKRADYAVYAIKRKNFYKKQWIRHCGWWPDWVKRVYRKGEVSFSADVIHESIQTNDSVGKMTHSLIHYSFKSPEDFLQRACWYAHHQAQDKFKRGKRSSAWTALSHGCFAWFQAYIIRLGFLDGTAGMLIAVSNFVGVFYRYMILRDLWMSQEASEGKENM